MGRSLLNDLKRDIDHAHPDHSKGFSRTRCNVDDASTNKRTTVIDSHDHGPSVRDIGHTQARSKRQGRMRRMQRMFVEPFAARGHLIFRVETRKPGQGGVPSMVLFMKCMLMLALPMRCSANFTVSFLILLCCALTASGWFAGNRGEVVGAWRTVWVAGMVMYFRLRRARDSRGLRCSTELRVCNVNSAVVCDA